MAKLTYTLTIPDENVEAFVVQLGRFFGYQSELTNPKTNEKTPNPQTVGDYVAIRIQQELVKRVKQQYLIDANKVATETAAANVEVDFKAKYASVEIVVDKTIEVTPVPIEL